MLSLFNRYETTIKPVVPNVYEVELKNRFTLDFAKFNYREVDKQLHVSNVYICSDNIRLKAIETMMEILKKIRQDKIFIESSGNIPFIEAYLKKENFRIEAITINSITAVKKN